jgi:hypothetical protein
VQRRQQRAARRARRFAWLALLSVVLVVSLTMTAFGGGSPSAAVPTVNVSSLVPQATRPSPQIVARSGALRLQLPISQSRVTAIGYHGAGTGAIGLVPIGRQGNAGLFQRLVRQLIGGGGSGPVWYQLGGGSGPSTSALDVGAPPRTDVYAPVDGTVVGITPYIVNGTRFGSRVDIQPQAAPGLVVSMTHLRPDPSLTVGAAVQAGTRKVGTVVDLSSVERQALARYTNDAGNHVSVEVRPAATISFSS